jgi:hypothetical protein
MHRAFIAAIIIASQGLSAKFFAADPDYIAAGFEYYIEKIARDLGVYARLLCGNIFGFVDSRETRLRISGRIELSR